MRLPPTLTPAAPFVACVVDDGDGLLVPLDDALPLALLLPLALALAEAEALDAEADALADAEVDAPDVVVPEMVLKVLRGVVPVEDPLLLALDEAGGGLSFVMSNCWV